MNSYMNHGRRCGQAGLILLIGYIASGCASNPGRDGVAAVDLSSVYVGMPRANFEDLVGGPIEKSQTRYHILDTYKYERGYTGCLASGRCLEANNSKTADTLLLVGTFGLSGLGTWFEVKKCQVGYLRARYGPEERLINIRLLAPEPFKGGTSLWEKKVLDPEPWYPCREIYNHPQPLTIPAAVLDNTVSSETP
jgi:hypothetical protein